MAKNPNSSKKITKNKTVRQARSARQNNEPQAENKTTEAEPKKTAAWSERLEKIRHYSYVDKAQQTVRRLWQTIRQWHLAARLKAFWQWLSDTWKTVILCLVGFLFCYYGIGSQLSEKIDVITVYVLPSEKTTAAETVNTMAFLLKREVDDKMWTPNLPALFPAYVLDDMPNFQMGIAAAVKNAAGALQKMQGANEGQLRDMKEAHQLLGYSPKVWLLARQGNFNIAPSSNTQYRKAAKRLRKFNEHGEFTAVPDDLAHVLAIFERRLIKLVQSNEEYVQEHSSDWFDFAADDHFYWRRGYAFALWQICKALGHDYKEIILHSDAYTEWTYLLSSLRTVAEFKPRMVRNGEIGALTAPNHLLYQNYMLARAIVSLEKIRRKLAENKVLAAPTTEAAE